MLLSYRNIRKSYEDLDVLKGIDIDINEGERIGVVGKNGAGKTSLANIIFGSLQYDSGSIIAGARELKIGYLLQSTSYSVNTFNALLDSDDTAGVLGDFSNTVGRLGLKQVEHWDESRLNGASGGERTKLALANVLVSRPDLLILDEPTNHLDFRGVEWLAEELQKYRGTIFVISHDRYFLDKIASRIIEIEDGKARSYSGNYSFYRARKKREYEEQLHKYYEQEKRKHKIEEEIARLDMWSAKAHRQAGKTGTLSERGQMGLKEFYRVKAKKLDKRAKSKAKRLEKMLSDGVSKPRKETELDFFFDGSGKQGRCILEAKNLTAGYGSRLLFKNSSFYVQRGEKVGLLGPNGCGKTTLVKLILGQMETVEGGIWISPSSSITYISQDVTDLSTDKTPLDFVSTIPMQNTGNARTILASLGIGGSMLKKRVGDMSLGERTRLKIAGAILEGNDFLILDEPTNHLDLYSREQLEDALEEYEGTLLIVSHDRFLLEKVCDKLLLFENESIMRLEGGFQEYSERFGEGGKIQKRDKVKVKEELMLLENQISSLLGKLSFVPREDPAYSELDMEFQRLVERKKELGRV